MDYREEMKQLRDFLNQQSYLYYVLDAPVIPDYEYDRLNRRLEELEAAVAALFPQGEAETGSLLTNPRQADAVGRALDAVRRAEESLSLGMTPDVILTDAEEALSALGELTGATAREEIVSAIFSRFCVGK